MSSIITPEPAISDAAELLAPPAVAAHSPWPSGWALGAFLAGVALQLQQPGLDAPAGWSAQTLFATLAVIAACGLALVWRICPFPWGFPKLWTRRLMTAALALLLGFSLTAARAAFFQAQALAPGLEGQNIVVTGSVQSMPQVNEDGVRFRFQPDSARLQNSDSSVQLPPQLYLAWYTGFGGRPTSLPTPTPVDRTGAAGEVMETPDFMPELQQQPQAIRAGDRWQMTIRLKAPHGSSNPHGFDFELWLWEQGLQATGYVRAGPRDALPRRLSSGWAHPVERARQSVREAIVDRVSNRQVAGILAALVVGDQNAIERADWDVFRATGVSHLMSISGLHITMFAWLASLLIGRLWRQSARLTPALCLAIPASSAGAIGGLLLAALYALFSGWGVPAQRTIAMLATVMLLRLGGRQWPWPLVWLLAMVVVAVLDPWALMQAGFWLSFVAVGVLFATDSGAVRIGNERARGQSDAKNQIVSRLVPANALRSALPIAQGLVRATREQWVITLALAPLSLLLFNQVSLVGLLANALAIPWVTLVVTPLALAGVAWAPIWDAAAAAVTVLGQFLQWLASWPLASVDAPAAPLLLAVAGVAGGVVLAMRLPWSWRLLGLPLMLPVILWQPLRPSQGQFDILAADVGQGNAVLVRTAGHSLVYDAGPRFSRDSDAGHRVLVPLLRALGEKIDILMLSHRDTDHIGGAPAILAMQPQARLISSIEDAHELQAVRRSERCVAGQQWRWDGIDFEVLHPGAQSYEAAAKPNTMSCVLRVSNGSRTVLLAGDIEAAQEAGLLADPGTGQKLKADVLLVPHHGSKTSSTAAFLGRVQPRFAIAQAGYRNRFGHPVESVMARYRERGITVLVSPACGAASWRSDEPDRMVCQREQGRRYWHHRLGLP